MKTMYLAGPAYKLDGVTLIDGETVFELLIKSQVPAFDTTNEILDALQPGRDGTTTSVVRITVEAIPFPTRS